MITPLRKEDEGSTIKFNRKQENEIQSRMRHLPVFRGHKTRKEKTEIALNTYRRCHPINDTLPTFGRRCKVGKKKSSIISPCSDDRFHWISVRGPRGERGTREIKKRTAHTRVALALAADAKHHRPPITRPDRHVLLTPASRNFHTPRTPPHPSIYNKPSLPLLSPKTQNTITSPATSSSLSPPPKTRPFD